MEKITMRTFILPATATLTLLGAISAASAADAVGVIKDIDTTKDMVTLDNGSSYSAPVAIKLSTFKVGEKVAITYSKSGAKMEISAMKPLA
jgi:Cu/Ag efflux protein CusF